MKITLDGNVCHVGCLTGAPKKRFYDYEISLRVDVSAEQVAAVEALKVDGYYPITLEVPDAEEDESTT